MTVSKDLKKRIRDRQAKTGESYTTARTHVLSEQAEVLAPIAAEPDRYEAVVLRTNRTSTEVRPIGEASDVTFKDVDASSHEPIVPGHIVTLLFEKRWSRLGRVHASGRIQDVRIDIPRLGLSPLALDGGEPEDIREYSEPARGRDEYSKLWRKLTAKPRPSYEFDELAWGSFPDEHPDDNPTCLAAELREAGQEAEAIALLMDTLARDLRVLDAHAGLGNIAFDDAPKRALAHYEVGIRIGELSLPANFNGLLVWGRLYNRAFLRCLHGYGLSLWRLGDFAGAEDVFMRILSFNPDDHQGVRFCWIDVRRGRSWQESQGDDIREDRRRILH